DDLFEQHVEISHGRFLQLSVISVSSRASGDPVFQSTSCNDADACSVGVTGSLLARGRQEEGIAESWLCHIHKMKLTEPSEPNSCASIRTRRSLIRNVSPARCRM